MLTPEDFRIMHKARIERLKELVPATMETVVMAIEHPRPALRIGCTNADQVDALTADSLALLYFAHQVFGALVVSIMFAGERAWEGDYRHEFASEVESTTSDHLDLKFMPATLEKPTTQATPATPVAAQSNGQTLPAQAIEDIAVDLNINPQTIADWVRTQGTEPLPWQNKLIIPGEIAVMAYNHFWDQAKESVLERRGLRLDSPTSPTLEKTRATRAPRKTAATKTAAKKKPAGRGRSTRTKTTS